MIYTVTLNPSIDYIAKTDELIMGKTNRTTEEQMYAGGKGINVSMVLQNFNMETTATGFVAGFIGDRIIELLDEKGISNNFCKLDNGTSRINVKIKTKVETELNGMGPVATEEDYDKLLGILDKSNDGDVIVLSGSVPKGIDLGIYQRICQRYTSKGIDVCIDAAGDLLVNALSANPFIIKPNKDELEGIFGIEIIDKADVIKYGKKLKTMGARNVLVSLGEGGAILIAEDGYIYESIAPRGEVINSVGAGDSMLAGFLYAYLENKSQDRYRSAFATAVCTGSATAFLDGFANPSDIDRYISEIENQIVIQSC